MSGAGMAPGSGSARESTGLCSEGKRRLSHLRVQMLEWAAGCTSVGNGQRGLGPLIKGLHSAPAVDHTETAFQMVTIIEMLCLSLSLVLPLSKRD